MDARQALAGAAKAITELLADEKLAAANPAEWSITGDLAIRMVPHFAGWRVSPEWDRREAEEKKIAWDDEEGKRLLKKIRPDIIVHQLLESNNLIVIEAKRSSNKGDYANDIRKLILMTKSISVDPDYHYGYRVGLHIVVDLPNQRLESAQAYTDGQADAELTAYFLSLVSR
jgi:hypothetical protein